MPEGNCSHFCLRVNVPLTLYWAVLMSIVPHQSFVRTNVRLHYRLKMWLRVYFKISALEDLPAKERPHNRFAAFAAKKKKKSGMFLDKVAHNGYQICAIIKAVTSSMQSVMKFLNVAAVFLKNVLRFCSKAFIISSVCLD